MSIRYFRPGNLTWWAGAASVLLGVLLLFLPDNVQVSELGRAVVMISGGKDVAPAELLVIGAGLIGLNDKFARGGT